jgi:vacuolar protein sorting-associated protein 33A
VEHDFFIFWVPRRTLVSNKILEEAGVIGDVNVSEFPLYFLPLDQDLLSLELEDSFSDLFLVSLNIKPASLDFPPSDLFE